MSNQVEPNRKRRSKKILQQASEHLFYEFQMFNNLVAVMRSGVIGESILNNAVLESFALHARVLLDFLYAEKPKEDDVIAGDYFDDPDDWFTVRPNKTDQLKTIHQRVGKEVAHLTYNRLGKTDEEKQWQIDRIEIEMNDVIVEFLNNVAKEKLGPSWGKVVVQSQAESASRP